MVRKGYLIIFLMLSSIVPVYLIGTQTIASDQQIELNEVPKLVPEFVLLDQHQYPVEVVDNDLIISEGLDFPITNMSRSEVSL